MAESSCFLLNQEINSDTLSERQGTKSLLSNLESENQKRKINDDLFFQQPSSKAKLDDELLKVRLKLIILTL